MNDTFPKLLVRQAEDRRDRPAVRVKRLGLWTTLTWSEVLDQVKTIACGLADMGVKRGDCVAVASANTPEMLFFISASQVLGAIPVPFNADAAGEQLAHALARARVKFAFAQDQQQVDAFLAVMPQCPELDRIVYAVPRGLANYDKALVHDISEVRKCGRAYASAHPDFFDSQVNAGKSEDIAFIFFSSGISTLVPRAVPLVFRNLLAAGEHIVKAGNITERDELLSFMPIAMPISLLYGHVISYITGFCLSYPESNETVLENLREIGPSLLYAPPHVYKYLIASIHNRIEFSGKFSRWLYHKYIMARMQLSADRSILAELLAVSPVRNVYGLSRVRVAVTGGDAISDEIIRFFQVLGLDIKQVYGSTETSGCITMQTNERSVGRVGHPVEGVEVKIGDNNEILCRGATVFSGYYEDEEATRAVLDSDGWFHTGDLGEFDADNELRVIDKIDAVGKLEDGRDFMPKVLENAMKASPYIKNAFVTGDGRSFLSALVVIDETIVGNWADHNNIRYTGHSELTGKAEVQDFIAAQVREANAKVGNGSARHPPVDRFILLNRDFSTQMDELTWTNKMCRPRIADHMKPLIDAMYGDDEIVAFSDQVGVQAAQYRACRI